MLPICDFDKELSSCAEEQDSENKRLLNGNNLMVSFDEQMDRELQKERLCLRDLIVTICVIALLIDIWPIALRPAMMSFFSWAGNWGYLSLWKRYEQY